ncbi:hypothetical protein FOCC_FOCC013193 [Frankliniella occidentalis]|nr:hypothetical protein FOCC_FOCC013193 [Frankliniella occidentalis]
MPLRHVARLCLGSASAAGTHLATMPVILRISFDRPYAAYYGGETVTGRVDMQVDKPTQIRAVTITFRGEASVHWTETKSKSSGTGSSTETVTYSASEIYFSNKVYFVGGDSGDITLSPGDYVYAFQCLLPPTLPNSFEGVHGHIRYTTKAVVHRPWKFDHGARAAFTVVAPLDLNMYPQARAPIEREQSKHFCCLWCKSGPLTMSVRVPHGGYVPGQTILLQIQIDNASTTNVRNLRGTLNQGNSIMDAKDGDNEYTMGIHNFTPRYPVWNLISPPQILD